MYLELRRIYTLHNIDKLLRSDQVRFLGMPADKWLRTPLI